ncbi:MAG: hypothetical protein U0269_19585 [Polyangiales bacterium]
MKLGARAALALLSGLSLVALTRVARAELGPGEAAWRRIAGRDRRAVAVEVDWSNPSTEDCSNADWFACVDRCRSGAINACADLSRAFSSEILGPDREALIDRLAFVADAFDAAELRFRAACAQTPSVVLACEVVRRLTFTRYRLACAHAAPSVSDTDASALRDGACRGVVRLLEDSAVSNEASLLESGLDTARAYCKTPDAMATDTCALMVSLHAREGRLGERMAHPSDGSSESVLDVARSVCAQIGRREGGPNVRPAWVQVCDSLIEQRAWSASVVQGLCASSDPAPFESCASVARGYVIDTRSREELPTLAGQAPSTSETLWFDAPIGVAPEARLGVAIAVNPRAAPWTARAVAGTVGVGARVRWHWLELVGALDVHAHWAFGPQRAQLAVDFSLQPGVVIVTTAARPSHSNRVFTASTGVVLRGGPALGEWGSDPWIGAVGWYGRVQWHRSSRKTCGFGLQAEITAPTWAEGDPSFALRGLLSF